jgi:hypothetical protein
MSIHSKKNLAVFPSPVGMSLTKLSQVTFFYSVSLQLSVSSASAQWMKYEPQRRRPLPGAANAAGQLLSAAGPSMPACAPGEPVGRLAKLQRLHAGEFVTTPAWRNHCPFSQVITSYTKKEEEYWNNNYAALEFWIN